MKKNVKSLASVLLFLLCSSSCIAGPVVTPHAKSPTVKVRDSKFTVIQEFKDPKKIKTIKDIFLRSKRVGDTKSHLKSITHKIDFSDRWLLNIKTGEIGVLSMAVVDVYQISPIDLKNLKKLIGNEE